jgi:alkanesulfonate monooxygenase SsuD/methylene tetrahydromethanopterin reductase-like flavin-dependent oxidoreductase (luciferase family)
MADPVRFGLYVTNQHPPGTDMVRALDEQLQVVALARDTGWDTIFTGHHYLSDMAQLQPVPFLARMAAEAGELQLGVGVQLIALLNPVDVAENIAALDVVTRGRLIYGVGLGYRDVEYDAMGAWGNRVERFERNLEIITQLWAGETVTADLPWCRLDGASLTNLPVQRPRPPLWIAANNDKAVERAARLGDTWMINPHARVETIERQLELFASARAAAGHAPVTELPVIKEVYCAPTREEAVQRARPHLDAKYRVYARWGQDKALPGDESFEIPFDDLEQERFVLGSPDDCIAQLLPLRDRLGVDHFIFRSHWSGMPLDDTLRSVRLLTDEVLPALRAR